MQQFIPFEDDWDALDNLNLSALIPFKIELADAPAPSSTAAAAQCTAPRSASIANTSPTRASMRLASPAASSNT